jgi:hypothetical protein
MKTRTYQAWLGIICATIALPIAGSKLLAQAVTTPPVKQTTFATPEAAVEALIAAAERFDKRALQEILGPDGADLVTTDDPVLDKKQAATFAAKAREKSEIVRDPKNPELVTLNVGVDAWPMPIPVHKQEGRWHFDSAAGREEILFRRIGENELNAIQMCLGYVEAQRDYASEEHDGSPIKQYAQHVISSPGKQDGLAWREADGTWRGPVGHAIATLIAEGYTDKRQPFHGYYFKILKGQGPDAPMGEMDFLVKGVMIGGFALVAAPSDYAVTGVKTFIVSQTGIVYEKDLGEETLTQFQAMEKYNPDASWSPVKDPEPATPPKVELKTLDTRAPQLDELSR